MRFYVGIRQRGFTLVELLVVIFVMGILSALVINYISGSKERAYQGRAQAELETIANAARLYVNKNDVYPPDTSRNIPAEIKEFIAKTSESGDWPKAPWPNSVYDYDAWDMDGDGVNETIQISIRFCPAGGPLSACTFPREPWAAGFKVDSAYYYCIKGYCRAHQSQPVTYPGYCYNCTDHAAVKKPSE